MQQCIARLGFSADLASRRNFLLSVLLIFLLSSLAQAQQSVEFDKYTVFYSVVPSRFLDKKIADKFGFLRSKGLGVINVTVEKNGSPKKQQVLSQIGGVVVDVRGRETPLQLRMVSEGNFTYSIGQFSFSEGALLTFKMDVYPQGESKPLSIQFAQNIYN